MTLLQFSFSFLFASSFSQQDRCFNKTFVSFCFVRCFLHVLLWRHAMIPSRMAFENPPVDHPKIASIATLNSFRYKCLVFLTTTLSTWTVAPPHAEILPRLPWKKVAGTLWKVPFYQSSSKSVDAHSMGIIFKTSSLWKINQYITLLDIQFVL